MNTSMDKISILLMLFDSQFPVGAFVFSWGLESFASSNLSKGEIYELIRAYIEEGPLDLELFSCKKAFESHNCVDCLNYTNKYLSAFKILPTVYEPSIKLGRNLVKACKEIMGINFPIETIKDPHFSVALGFVGGKLAIALDIFLFAFAHSCVKNLINTLMRCIPLSAYDAWKMLTMSGNKIEKRVSWILSIRNWDEICLNTFHWDIHSYRQNFLETRLFEG